MDKVIRYTVIDNSPEDEKSIQKDLKDLMGSHDYRIIWVSNKEDIHTLYAFLEDHEVRPLTNIFKKYGMIIEYKDISQDIITGKLPNKEDKKEFEFVTWRRILNNFRVSNTTVDDILDVINDSGMGSLDELHLEILKKS